MSTWDEAPTAGLALQRDRLDRLVWNRGIGEPGVSWLQLKLLALLAWKLPKVGMKVLRNFNDCAEIAQSLRRTIVEAIFAAVSLLRVCGNGNSSPAMRNHLIPVGWLLDPN